MLRFFRKILRDSLTVYVALIRIMIPVVILVKIVQVCGGVEWLSRLLGPVLGCVGLPGSMSLVLATAMATNLYAGLVAFSALSAEVPMSVAQVTVLTSMMLVAHALPLELRIAQKAGVRMRALLLTRIAGAFLLGLILHHVYRWGGWLEGENVLLWRPTPAGSSLGDWALHEAWKLGFIFLIVLVLLMLLASLERIGVTRLLDRLLRPLLRRLGIGEQATSITIVGMTLGISYGGGLLIHESRAGHVSSRDVLFTMTLLSLCHSLIEDTLLMRFVGGHFSGILWARLIFSLIWVFCFVRWTNRCSPEFVARHLVREVDTSLKDT